jgi:hypothetical protein
VKHVLVALLFAGCVAPEAPPDPDLARPAPVIQRVPSLPPPLPALAEVELSGAIDFPVDAKGEPRVFVTTGECWQADTRSLGDVKPNGKSFFLEFMVPQGTQLWICGAMVPAKGPITIYGRSPKSPVLGRGAGEVILGQLDLKLEKGPPVKLPAPADPSAGTRKR